MSAAATENTSTEEPRLLGAEFRDTLLETTRPCRAPQQCLHLFVALQEIQVSSDIHTVASHAISTDLNGLDLRRYGKDSLGEW